MNNNERVEKLIDKLLMEISKGFNHDVLVIKELPVPENGSFAMKIELMASDKSIVGFAFPRPQGPEDSYVFGICYTNPEYSADILETLREETRFTNILFSNISLKEFYRK